MAQARCPSLFQINTRVWLTEICRALRRPATPDDVPDAALDCLASPLPYLGLQPRWHPIEQYLCARPHVIRQSHRPSPAYMAATTWLSRCR